MNIEQFLCDYFNDTDKLKSTLHFDKQVKCNKEKTQLKSDILPLEKLISKQAKKKYTTLLQPKNISEYAFLPFIGYEITERRVSKIKQKIIKNGKRVTISIPNKDYKSGLDKKNKVKKTRPIHYASHRANLIYSYYAQILQEKYENHIESLGISDSVLAYRKVSRKDKKKQSELYRENSQEYYYEHTRINNITMAREVFDEIAKRIDNGGCYVFAYDLEGFFNHLDHRKLYKLWCTVLSVDNMKIEELPKDHKNIFKSLTKYSYINLHDLYEFFQEQLKQEKVCLKRVLKKQSNKTPCVKLHSGRVKQSRKGIYYGEKATLKALKNIFDREVMGNFNEFKSNFLEKGFEIIKNPDKYGIPQGTPISAVLANIYMIDFDLKMKKLCDAYNLFYRRYSDDILIIAPLCQQTHDMILKKIDGVKSSEQLSEFQQILGKPLKIHPIDGGKSQLIKFDPSDNKTARVSYLGFDFEYNPNTLIPKKVFLRQSGVARYYRKLIMWVRSSTRGLMKNKPLKHIQRGVLYKKRILSLYSFYKIKDKNSSHNFGNYLTYVYKKSTRILGVSKYYKTVLKSPLKSHCNRLHILYEQAELLFVRDLEEYKTSKKTKKLRTRKEIKWKSKS